MPTMFASSNDGARIAHDVTGSGPALVLLHGAGKTRRDWHKAGYVDRLKDDYTVITVIDTADGYRQLIFDGRLDGSDAIQSEMSLAAPDELTLPYARHMMAALPAAARLGRVLIVGLGGACMQRYLYGLLPETKILLDHFIQDPDATPSREVLAATDGFKPEEIERAFDELEHLGYPARRRVQP